MGLLRLALFRASSPLALSSLRIGCKELLTTFRFVVERVTAERLSEVTSLSPTLDICDHRC